MFPISQGRKAPSSRAMTRNSRKSKVLRPISAVGGGHQGGLLTPTGIGKANY